VALLSWNIVSPMEYTPGEEISFSLHFEAPVAGRYYLLGALYIDIYHPPSTIFGVRNGVNDPAYTSVWELGAAEAVDLPCRFMLDRTNCLLALFLMRMAGDEVNLDGDEKIAQVQAQLAAPVPEKQIMQTVVPIVGGVMLLGLVAVTMHTMFKE